jgi:malonate-semialdehyde dehydrogenase (acetylating)/methylmalonate-semialdehyde dehydrogenase
MATTVLDHWVSGAAFAGASTRTAPVYDPARGVVQREVRLASVADVDTAVQAAVAAFPAWSEASWNKRQAVLFAFREILNARKEELAAILTSEHGKVTPDALGEIARGIEVVEFACGIPHLAKGEYSENVSTGVDVYSVRQALGVVGIISPFNFPAMVPMWFFPIAIALGNTVVLKPSEKDPSAAIWMAQAMKEAGLPDGVLNVVHGDKEAVDAILTHPDVASISFVGSTPIAKYVYETGTAAGKRVQALGGAKNHMLVLPDADLDLVADSAVNAGFGSAGERCMAISVVVAVGDIADDLIPKIVSRMSGLRVGDGTRGCDMGPLITKEHRDKVAGYLDVAMADGAEIVVDGRGSDDLRRLPPRDLRPRALNRAGRHLRGGSRPHQRQPLRQRNGDLHQRRRRRTAFPARGDSRHDRHQRAHSRARRLLLLRRLEGLPLRRHQGIRPRRHPLLHPPEGHHLAVA